jgi:hypothetical protein
MAGRLEVCGNAVFIRIRIKKSYDKITNEMR